MESARTYRFPWRRLVVPFLALAGLRGMPPSIAGPVLRELAARDDAELAREARHGLADRLEGRHGGTASARTFMALGHARQDRKGGR